MFGALQHDRGAAARARAQFAEACAPLPPTSWRAAALLGELPRAAPDARAVANRLGLPRPRLAPVARPQPAPVEPGSALGTCHAALRAERYGALIRMPQVGPSLNPGTGAAAAGDRVRAEPYDRLLQVPLGPLAAVQAAWPRIAALARLGASVRLLFAARDQHHVVLRDLDAHRLARLRADGHAPALVLEGRPGRFEAVLRAPSGGSTDEPAAVRRVGQTLARRYGCSVSDWGVRVVRAPEPDNDATEPRSGVEARFVAWTGEACPRLATLVAEGARRLRALRALLARPMPGSRPGPWWRRVGLAPPTRAEAAIYHAHRRDILTHWEGRRPDNSRVDARIARRLRATGHGETAVAASIAACAAALAPYRRRDWAAYGRRAAALAFAPDAVGGAEVDAGTERVAAWAALERRTRERVDAVAALRSATARPVEVTAPAPAVLPAEVGRGDGTVAQHEPAPQGVIAPAIVPPVPVTAPTARPAIHRPGRIEPSHEQRAILRPQEDRPGALLADIIVAMRGAPATPVSWVEHPNDRTDHGRGAEPPRSDDRRREAILEDRPSSDPTEPSPDPATTSGQADEPGLGRHIGSLDKNAAVLARKGRREPDVTHAGAEPSPPRQPSDPGYRLGEFGEVDPELEQAKHGVGRVDPARSSSEANDVRVSESQVSPSRETSPPLQRGEERRNSTGPVPDGAPIDQGVERSTHGPVALGADPVMQGVWNPLADTLAKDRLVVGYFLLALQSGQHTVQRWRSYLRQAVGKELAARVEAWHAQARGTPEQARTLTDAQRMTGGWNFNAVDRVCRHRGVRTPEI